MLTKRCLGLHSGRRLGPGPTGRGGKGLALALTVAPALAPLALLAPQPALAQRPGQTQAQAQVQSLAQAQAQDHAQAQAQRPPQVLAQGLDQDLAQAQGQRPSPPQAPTPQSPSSQTPSSQAPSTPQAQSPAQGSSGGPPAAEEAPGDMPPPPPDLVVLVDKVGVKGRYRLGVFGRKADPTQPQVWRLNLWEQTLDRLFISTDVLNCSPTQPMRITGGSGQGNGRLILRELNPGGPITPFNRLDHQIWWAACFPQHAGKDPATLAGEARRLGFSGTLLEQEQVVPGARRP